MWNLSLPWWEFVVRGVIVYVFLIILIRLTGKRQTGQLVPFDLILLLVLSNAVQNSMNGGDNSVVGGLISSVTLVGLNYVVALATYKFKWAETLIEGRPLILVHNGELVKGALQRARLTRHELDAALRGSGCNALHSVHSAVLENNGQISVTLRHQ